MSGWTVAWLLWIAAFFVIEGLALWAPGKGDTLSEHFRRWFDTGTRAGRWLWVIASGVFFTWFTVHIAVAGSI